MRYLRDYWCTSVCVVRGVVYVALLDTETMLNLLLTVKNRSFSLSFRTYDTIGLVFKRRNLLAYLKCDGEMTVNDKSFEANVHEFLSYDYQSNSSSEYQRTCYML